MASLPCLSCLSPLSHPAFCLSFFFFPPSTSQYVWRAYGVPEFNQVIKSMESHTKEKNTRCSEVCSKAGQREGTWSQRKPEEEATI